MIGKWNFGKLINQITHTSYYKFLNCNSVNGTKSDHCAAIEADKKEKPVKPKRHVLDGMVKYFEIPDTATEWYINSNKSTEDKGNERPRIKLARPIRCAKQQELNYRSLKRISPEFWNLLQANTKQMMDKEPRYRLQPRYLNNMASLSYYKFRGDCSYRHMRIGIDTAAPVEFPCKNKACPRRYLTTEEMLRAGINLDRCCADAVDSADTLTSQSQEEETQTVVDDNASAKFCGCFDAFKHGKLRKENMIVHENKSSQQKSEGFVGVNDEDVGMNSDQKYKRKKKQQQKDRDKKIKPLIYEYGEDLARQPTEDEDNEKKTKEKKHKRKDSEQSDQNECKTKSSRKDPRIRHMENSAYYQLLYNLNCEDKRYKFKERCSKRQKSPETKKKHVNFYDQVNGYDDGTPYCFYWSRAKVNVRKIEHAKLKRLEGSDKEKSGTESASSQRSRKRKRRRGSKQRGTSSESIDSTESRYIFAKRAPFQWSDSESESQTNKCGRTRKSKKLRKPRKKKPFRTVSEWKCNHVKHKAEPEKEHVEEYTTEDPCESDMEWLFIRKSQMYYTNDDTGSKQSKQDSKELEDSNELKKDNKQLFLNLNSTCYPNEMYKMKKTKRSRSKNQQRLFLSHRAETDESLFSDEETKHERRKIKAGKKNDKGKTTARKTESQSSVGRNYKDKRKHEKRKIRFANTEIKPRQFLCYTGDTDESQLTDFKKHEKRKRNAAKKNEKQKSKAKKTESHTSVEKSDRDEKKHIKQKRKYQKTAKGSNQFLCYTAQSDESQLTDAESDHEKHKSNSKKTSAGKRTNKHQKNGNGPRQFLYDINDESERTYAKSDNKKRKRKVGKKLDKQKSNSEKTESQTSVGKSDATYYGKPPNIFLCQTADETDENQLNANKKSEKGEKKNEKSQRNKKPKTTAKRRQSDKSASISNFCECSQHKLPQNANKQMYCADDGVCLYRQDNNSANDQVTGNASDCSRPDVCKRIKYMKERDNNRSCNPKKDSDCDKRYAAGNARLNLFSDTVSITSNEIVVSRPLKKIRSILKTHQFADYINSGNSVVKSKKHVSYNDTADTSNEYASSNGTTMHNSRKRTVRCAGKQRQTSRSSLATSMQHSFCFDNDRTHRRKHQQQTQRQRHQRQRRHTSASTDSDY